MLSPSLIVVIPLKMHYFLRANQAQQLLNNLPGWELSPDNKKIFKDYKFPNYHQTMAFVNAIAWLAHQENHHPDLEVGYSHCKVHYNTHAIDGLSENDFICATKVEKLQA